MKLVLGCLLGGVYLSALGAERYWMPGWSTALASGAIIGAMALVWPRSKGLAIGLGVFLGSLFGIFSEPFLEEAESPLVLHTSQATYVVRNHCFLDCRPVVYKKYPYFPYLKRYQDLGTQRPIERHSIQNDTLYLSNGLRAWAIY